MTKRVLIVTGGLVTGLERSAADLLRKWGSQWRHSDQPWLDLKVKLSSAEPVLRTRLAQRLGGALDRSDRRMLGALLHQQGGEPPRTLTEVVLATALQDAGMTFETLTIDTLFADPRTARRAVQDTDCVFLSTTLLHDLSEVTPIVERLRLPHNRVVVGGALAGSLGPKWRGVEGVDVLAIGYGELLVPALADWIRSDFRDLQPPPHGRIEQRDGMQVLHSGTPAQTDLDFLPTPRWELLTPPGDAHPGTISYESVRGCPYSCGFCNYPNLFDDNRFRYKSAERMADDWTHYRRTLGVDTIICLDSLFTMPKRRLRRFCELLIERDLGIRWVCYARADDLTDPDTVRLMRQAGVVQVQIGLESGDPDQLARMNKRCDVEANLAAIEQCRAHGITSAVSLVVGYPGETAESLERTFRFLERARPDFYLLATFNVRVEGVPVMRPESRKRFALRVAPSLHNMAPYWQHGSMACDQAVDHVRALDRRLMANRVSLNAMTFYRSMLDYAPGQRSAMLDLQQRAMSGQRPLEFAFDAAHRAINRRIAPALVGL